MTYNYCSWNIILLVCRNRTFFSSVSLITLSDRKLKSDIFELTRWYRNYFFFHLFQKHFSTQGKSWSRCNVVSIINRKQRSQNASKVRKQTKKQKQKKRTAKRSEKRAQRTLHPLNLPSFYSIRKDEMYVRLSWKTFN